MSEHQPYYGEHTIGCQCVDCLPDENDRPPESRPMTVYILWESSSPSSPPELVDIYATREAAEEAVKNQKCQCGHIRAHHSNASGNCYDCECWEYLPWHDPDYMEIEEREVKS